MIKAKPNETYSRCKQITKISEKKSRNIKHNHRKMDLKFQNPKFSIS